MNRLQLSNQLQNQCNNIEIAFAGADMILIVHLHVWPEIRPLGFKGLMSGNQLPFSSTRVRFVKILKGL